MPFRLPTATDLADLERNGVVLKHYDHAVVSGPPGSPDGIVAASRKPFETEFLGKAVAQIETITTVSLTCNLAALVSACVEQLREAGFGYVAARRDEADVEGIDALQSAGLHITECLLTLRRCLASGEATKMNDLIDVASASDAEAVAALGRICFTQDRFHADRRILKTAADALKEAWARNAVLGRADRVFIARAGGEVAGFNACLLRGEEAVIDLIGVSPHHQGEGLGRALVSAALSHYAGTIKHMLVGTQSRNYASLALYGSLGFRVHASAFTFSRHLA